MADDEQHSSESTQGQRSENDPALSKTDSANGREFFSFSYYDQFIISEADKKQYRHLLLDNGLQVLLVHEPEGLKSAPISNSSSANRDNYDAEDGNDSSDSDNDADNSASGSSDDSDRESVGSDSGRTGRSRGVKASSSARRSAAALCIASGSSDEGAELAGLAHFLEHMVFMGSAKYPTENDFDAYVSERGGESNAWTDMERTMFYFDCSQESFADCLDRFANFFVDPLLSADSLEREVQAVHSEFEQACCSLQSQLEFFTGCLTSPGHPLSGFKWGNKVSLWDLPRTANIDVRSKLEEFRRVHYRAGNMTAALQSRLSLDAMEAAARAAFEGLPPGPRTASPERPLATGGPAVFGDGFLGRVYCLLPVKQVDRLRLAWPCPPARDRHLEQTHRLIGFCLAHEGAGSLADCLRREGLAVELVAGVHTGCGLYDNAWLTLMELSLKLTPKGLLDWRRVVRLVYAYIGMMGANLDQIRRIFDELQLVERADFRFAEEAEPADSVETLSLSMSRLPPRFWLLGDHRVPHRYHAEAVRDYWRCLRPENACLLLASRSFESACDRVTDWFEIRYSELPPDPVCLADWQNCVDSPDAQLLADYGLHMPPPNPFIATRFDVPSAEQAYAELGLSVVPQFPVRLTLDDPKWDRFGELFYFKDRQFKTPRAVVRVSLESPAIPETLKSSTMVQVWLYMLNFQLHRDAYAANEAGLSYDIVQSEPFAIIFDLEGFNDKLFVLYSTILSKLEQFGLLLQAGDSSLNFESAKEEIRKLLANDLFSAKRFASNVRHFLTEPQRYLASDQLQCLEPVSLADVAEFHKSLLSRVFFKVYVHGNCLPQDAKEYFKRTLAILPPDAQAIQLKHEFEAMPPGRHGVRLRGMRRGDVNSLLVEEVQFPFPPSLRDMAFADLLLHIMWEPCFDFLRTKHQLGYQVHCQAYRRRSCLSFRLLVASQADQCSMDKVQTMVNKFALHFLDNFLRKLKPDQFANYVKAVVDRKLAENSVMADEADRYWEEIDEGGLLFDRRVREAQILQQLTLKELEPFYKQVMSLSRRSFVYEIEGSQRKVLHEGGTAGYSLPLVYAKPLKPPSRLAKQPKGSTAAYAPGIDFIDDVRVFKAGLNKLTASPVLD
ncbi:hypothetical protein BOX15_Mlig032179g1 [Macrostomum lignano]|uniref:Nardilysin n=1 Tax=Macrostomum lignano TaxID=282301 RepID=A0A267GWN1_9PLAT|nr:hypothetical protein BOX15_Mlig032179g1 [Macrostomum lignano]